MDRLRRTISRHRLQLLLVVFLPMLIGTGIAYLLPREYQATATLWALHNYNTLTATNIDANSLDTPAESQATALSEMLQTRSFALAVAQEAKLASSLGGDVTDDTLISAVSQSAQVTAQAYDLFTIQYTSTDPVVAQRVVQAIIDQYNQEIKDTASAEGQNLLQPYQVQLTQAQQDAQNAQDTQNQYLAAHPQETPSQLQTDPAYQQLHLQVQQAQQKVQALQDIINALEQQIASHTTIANGLYRVLDAPTVPTKPALRTKTLLIGGATGLLLGLIAATLLTVLMMRSDRKIYTRGDLREVTATPVVMELPLLSGKAVEVIVKTSGQPNAAASQKRT
ncbi:MAG TPA: hypothetical protein VKX46_13900 [Ktedonobacteraceae bacterium]|nr:hypothetical protein [Ktedonobacteraceae bacterium]